MGIILAESDADQPPLSHHSSRRPSFVVIVVTETRRVRKTKKRSEPESLHQRQGSGTQPQARETGEHPSHASQSRESEIASSSFSPVSGPEGNSLHCLVKKWKKKKVKKEPGGLKILGLLVNLWYLWFEEKKLFIS
ncbi:hypothetical protein PIB30_052968 [Stylosanthes scabra]|uniref:Uncharacterized protein n=1 Tax=Stylosanthes scabra TaxID=79078 RepID=A0ABU6SJ00_9FABA|nr:hypothetical protein [Stylosanthes scabra]